MACCSPARLPLLQTTLATGRDRYLRPLTSKKPPFDICAVSQ